MAKTKISEWDSNPNNNTDIDSINIAEGCAPSGINNAIRELMSQVKDYQQGTYSDPFNGPVNGTIGATTPAAGAFTTLTASSTATLNTLTSSGATLTGGSINNMAIGGSTASTGAFTTLAASGAVTLSGGTANGVTYLNGSKVLTTGSALTFDGTNLGLGVTPSAWGTSGTILKAINVAGAQNFIAGGASFNGVFVGSNAYFDGTNWKYVNTNGAAYYNAASGSHAWYTAPSGTAGNAISFTQAMTLDASGNLQVGTTTSGGAYATFGNTSASGANRWAAVFGTNSASAGSPSSFGLTVGWNYSSGGGENNIIYGTSAGSLTGLAFSSYNGTTVTERARIDSSGNLQVSNLAGTGNRAVYSTSTGILTNSSSDRSLKENDAPISQGLDAVLAMRPVSFEWVDKDKMGAQREIGFIAQEMQQIVPEVVGSNSDETLSIDYPKLVAVMAKAIQELTDRVKVLEAK